MGGSSFLSPPAKRPGPGPVPAPAPAPRSLCRPRRSLFQALEAAAHCCRQLQRDAAAKIRVEELHPGVKDRVIVVVASSSVGKRVVLKDSEEGVEVSAVREAVVRLFERILEVAKENEAESSVPGDVVACRLLANSSQGIRKETGCRIKVISSEKLPDFASLNDEMIQGTFLTLLIDGGILAVKKALVAVSHRLLDCPPGDSSQMTRKELLLCPSDKVGGIIGKGGTIVKALQKEAGALITVGPTLDGCYERLITIAAIENPGSWYSPAQNAVLLVFNRSIEAGIEDRVDLGSCKGSPVTAQIVVPWNRVGCLFGKGGIIISKMRKVTVAGTRIIKHDQVPMCAPENDEVIQITGEFFNVRDALFNVTGRLCDNPFPGKMLGGAESRSNYCMITGLTPSERGGDPASVQVPTFAGASQDPYTRADLTQNIGCIGLSHSYDHPPFPMLWSSQAFPVGGVNPIGMVDVDGGLTSVKHGLELGRILIISGTLEETQAAQSLLDAFIAVGP
ncbi:hypothetical protein NMG60_11019037 [Bertholletia excelsa]